MEKAIQARSNTMRANPRAICALVLMRIKSKFISFYVSNLTLIIKNTIPYTIYPINTAGQSGLSLNPGVIKAATKNVAAMLLHIVEIACFQRLDNNFTVDDQFLELRVKQCSSQNSKFRSQ